MKSTQQQANNSTCPLFRRQPFVILKVWIKSLLTFLVWSKRIRPILVSDHISSVLLDWFSRTPSTHGCRRSTASSSHNAGTAQINWRYTSDRTDDQISWLYYMTSKLQRRQNQHLRYGLLYYCLVQSMTDVLGLLCNLSTGCQVIKMWQI